MALLAAKARMLEGRSAKDVEKLVAYCSDQVQVQCTKPFDECNCMTP